MVATTSTGSDRSAPQPLASSSPREGGVDLLDEKATGSAVTQSCSHLWRPHDAYGVHTLHPSNDEDTVSSVKVERDPARAVLLDATVAGPEVRP